MIVRKKTALLNCLLALIWVQPALAQGKTKIGVSIPLTGDAATYGTDNQKILRFANNVFAGEAYELIFADDKCSGAEAITIAHRFIDIDKINFVLGLPCSGALLAAAPVYDKAGVTVISTGASSPVVSSAGDYIFRTWPSDALFAAALAQYIAERHTRLGEITEETEYSRALSQAMAAEFNARQLSLIEQSYLPGTNDFRSLLLKLKTSSVDGLILNPQAERGLIALVKQLKEIRWDVPLYGNYFPSSSSFIAATKEIRPLSITFTDNPALVGVLGQDGEQLYETFKKQQGELASVDYYFVSTINAFIALHEAIKSGAPVKDYLYRTTFKGISGPFSFDQNGDIVGAKPMVKLFKDGNILPLSE